MYLRSATSLSKFPEVLAKLLPLSGLEQKQKDRMAEEVKTQVRKLMSYVTGLHAIVIADRDGVPMLKVADEHAPELALRPAYLSSFSHMTEQASKMGIGNNQTIIGFYDNVQVVQLNKHPMTVTFIADADSITGEILNLELDLQDLLVELRKLTEMPQ